jgi:hypothetical protein
MSQNLADEAYNDGALQYGAPGFANIFNKAGALVGSFLIEAFTPSDPSNKIVRPNEIGGANGFVSVNKQKTASCVIQLGVAGAAWPQNGNYFIVTSDPGQPNEKWILSDRSTPQDMNGYFKSSFSADKAKF